MPCLVKGARCYRQWILDRSGMHNRDGRTFSGLSVGINLAAEIPAEKKSLPLVCHLLNQLRDWFDCVTWLCVQKTWFNVHWTNWSMRWAPSWLTERVLRWSFLVRRLRYEPAHPMADMWRPWRRGRALSVVSRKPSVCRFESIKQKTT